MLKWRNPLHFFPRNVTLAITRVLQLILKVIACPVLSLALCSEAIVLFNLKLVEQ